MRKIFILSAVAASAVMTIVSCSKEQSEINPESIPGKATITGTLSYSLGQSYSSSAGFSEEIVPAAGVTVFVDVDNSGFKDGATGYTTYETVTDETGNYSVTVPATSQGVDVNIRANDFVAEASVVEGQKNGSPVFKTGDAIYHLEEYQHTGVKPGNVVEYSGMFDCQFFSEPVSFDYSGQVAFRVGFNSFDRNGNYSFTFADENVNVIVTAEYSGYDVPRKYGVTVRGGEAELEIPLLEENCKVNLTVEALRVVGEFSDQDNARYEGTYEQYNYSYGEYSPQTVEATFDGLTTPVVNIAMLFKGFVDTPYHSYAYYWEDAFNSEWE